VLSGDFAEYSALIAVRSSPRAAVKRRDDYVRVDDDAAACGARVMREDEMHGSSSAGSEAA